MSSSARKQTLLTSRRFKYSTFSRAFNSDQMISVVRGNIVLLIARVQLDVDWTKHQFEERITRVSIVSVLEDEKISIVDLDHLWYIRSYVS